MFVKEDLDYEDIEKRSASQILVQKKMSKKMKIFVTILILVFLAGAGVGLYYILKPVLFIYSTDSSSSAHPLKN